MTDQHPENNRVLHELLGRCWHDPDAALEHIETLERKIHCRKCDTWYIVANPNYAADPRLVLEGMRERDDYSRFVLWLFREYVSFEQIPFWLDGYILDRTGRLRDLAIEFLKEEGK